MREITRFRFLPAEKPDSRDEGNRMVRAFFEKYNFEGCGILTLDSGEPLTEQLPLLAEAEGLKAERYDYMCTYRGGELEAYDYIAIRELFHGPADDASEYQTEHDTTVCPGCGKIYKKAVPPLYYNKSEFRGKPIARTMEGSIVVTEDLKKAIEEEGLRGVVFSGAKHYNGRMKKEYASYMMEVKNVLPLMREEAAPDRHEFYCGACHGTILFGSHPRYDADAFGDGFDFYLTTEHIGRILHGEQMLIVSREAYLVISRFWKQVKRYAVGVETLQELKR